MGQQLQKRILQYSLFIGDLRGILSNVKRDPETDGYVKVKRSMALRDALPLNAMLYIESSGTNKRQGNIPVDTFQSIKVLT